ncbi:MAG: hypothetical protein LAP87_13315 [Acidobacteriia bacterium]|nr:hypothetical protein [Terriglobia bacterium]
MSPSTLFDLSVVEPLLGGIGPAEMGAIMHAFTRGSPADRIAAVEAALHAGGTSWRKDVGHWVAGLVPVELLVPEIYRHWRPLVEDAMQFVFARLSDRRLAAKIVEQIELPRGTASEVRLLRLISRMPGLQKIGQVVARNRSLAPSLRVALSELENGLSDATADEIRAILVDRLGPLLETHAVEIQPAIFREGTASAIVRFTWRRPDGDRERGVFKVLKPYVPACFAEDLTLVEHLGEYLASRHRRYDFAIHDVREMLGEVRLLLEHELDFPREQATLLAAPRTFRASIGIRVPRLIEPLSTPEITAMTEEDGVKVTDAFPRSPIRRDRIAEQLIEALIAVPLFSREDPATFHADPHAGNLLYDQPNRELILIDWALAESMSLELRRHLVMLCLMMILRRPEGVRQAIHALSQVGPRRPQAHEEVIDRYVARFFDEFPADRSPGVLDAMLLMDDIALAGVHFPAPLFIFRKIVFTLDGVLHDVVQEGVRIDLVIAREFLTRYIASLGVFHAPLGVKDLANVEWNALLYPARSLGRTLRGNEKAGATVRA